METALQIYRDEIARICREHGVRRLAVFGSAIRPDFEPNRSDTDFLVEFKPLSAQARMRNYLGLHAALVALLSHPVDLVEEGAISNPYIQKSVASQQQVLYAA
ncbi:MAG TPA: nucleotidyltransferase domain-containing protein [Terracidiphilus sp.]|jgi:predicted nucleotidyltransferase|nr:nucleotidyltransferase domain-containing protein [Terracidiphilus sp.]